MGEVPLELGRVRALVPGLTDSTCFLLEQEQRKLVQQRWCLQTWVLGPHPAVAIRILRREGRVSNCSIACVDLRVCPCVLGHMRARTAVSRYMLSPHLYRDRARFEVRERA